MYRIKNVYAKYGHKQNKILSKLNYNIIKTSNKKFANI